MYTIPSPSVNTARSSQPTKHEEIDYPVGMTPQRWEKDDPFLGDIRNSLNTALKLSSSVLIFPWRFQVHFLFLVGLISGC